MISKQELMALVTKEKAPLRGLIDEAQHFPTHICTRDEWIRFGIPISATSGKDQSLLYGIERLSRPQTEKSTERTNLATRVP